MGMYFVTVASFKKDQRVLVVVYQAICSRIMSID